MVDTYMFGDGKLTFTSCWAELGTGTLMIGRVGRSMPRMQQQDHQELRPKIGGVLVDSLSFMISIFRGIVFRV